MTETNETQAQCPECDGTGRVERYAAGYEWHTAECDTCNGTGHVTLTPTEA